MKNPKISVIMSVFNGEEYLRLAIESVLNQTFRDFELIIVDDASSDSSAEIIKSYQDDRIFFIQNDENLGLTKSLNKTLKVAKGDYIARLDHDDICYLNRFEKQLKYFDKYVDCQIVFSNITKIDDSGNKIPSYSRVKNPEDIYYLMHFINPVIHPTVLIKRELIVNGFNEEYKYAQDYELWSRLIHYYKFYKINEPLVYYRESDKQISKGNLPEQKKFAEMVFENMMKKIGFESISDEILYFHKNAFQDKYKLISLKHLRLLKEINKRIKDKAPEFLNKNNLDNTAKTNYYYYLSVYLRKLKIFNPLINLFKSI